MHTGHKCASDLGEDILTPEKHDPVWREDIPTSKKHALDLRGIFLTSEKYASVLREDIPTPGNHALDLRHNIPTWGWSAPNLGQVFQTLRRLLPILILCYIIAGTCLVDAGQVAMIEDPCLRKTGR